MTIKKSKKTSTSISKEKWKNERITIKDSRLEITIGCT